MTPIDPKTLASADAYEVGSRLSDDPLETLDDIDFTEVEDVSATPELSAMHEYLGEDEEE